MSENAGGAQEPGNGADPGTSSEHGKDTKPRNNSEGSVPESPSRGHELSQQSLVSREGQSPAPRVGLIMGSDSDWATMEDAAQALLEFEVPFEVGVVSAHRTPRKMLDYAETAADRGVQVIIAGAGGAAHLPGMVAASTPLPVIGVPVPLARLDGMDSLLSIVQMPGGVPVATVSIGGARNAGLLAVRILAASDPALQRAMLAFQSDLERMVHDKDEALRRRLLG